MGITQPLPYKVTVEKSDGSFQNQDIKYKWRPTFCQNCVQFGNYIEDCGKENQHEYVRPPKAQKKVQTKQPQEKNEWKVKQDIVVPNDKYNEPSKDEEKHNAPTHVQVHRCGKHAVVF